MIQPMIIIFGCLKIYFLLYRRIDSNPAVIRYLKIEEEVFIRNIRIMFDGDQRYTEEETKQLQGFFKYLREQKYSSKELFVLIKLRNIPLALRYLYAFKFDYPKALDSLKAYFQWRTVDLPKMVLNPNLMDAIVFRCIKIAR